MKVPFTQQAQKLVVMKLMKLHNDGYDANALLEKSAIYGYRSVFPDETMRQAKEVKEGKDAALQKLDADRLKTAPPSPEIRAKLAALRQGTV